MLTISEVGKAFGGRTLFSDVTLQVNHESRIGLMWVPTVVRKSTLFNLILQKESPDTGIISFQRNATVGFLPQESAGCGGRGNGVGTGHGHHAEKLKSCKKAAQGVGGGSSDGH